MEVRLRTHLVIFKKGNKMHIYINKPRGVVDATRYKYEVIIRIYILLSVKMILFARINVFSAF